MHMSIRKGGEATELSGRVGELSSRDSLYGNRITGRERFFNPLINQLFLALLEVLLRLAISWRICCREVRIGLACARHLDRQRLQLGNIRLCLAHRFQIVSGRFNAPAKTEEITPW
jgi:hypothetical protein